MNVLELHPGKNNPSFRLAERPDPIPGEKQLLIKVEAIGVNRADLMQKAGNYPPPPGVTDILGLEVAGFVESVGIQTGRFEPGDPVMALLAGGGYSDRAVVNEGQVMPIPEGLSMEEAAAIPEAFLTAFQALKWVGEIRRRDRVLIHGGGSGVGTAAIQLARQLFDAKVVVTAGHPDKLRMCRELGAELAIHYKKKDPGAEIQKAFGPQSVDVIVDMVGATHFDMNMDLLAMDGRLVLISMLGGGKVKDLNLAPILRRRLSIRGTTLRNRPDEYKQRLVSDFMTYAEGRFESGELKPVIDSIWDWTQVDKAHRRMERNLNIGKIVLTGM